MGKRQLLFADYCSDLPGAEVLGVSVDNFRQIVCKGCPRLQVRKTRSVQAQTRGRASGKVRF